jgi:hypothetical protein
MEENAVRGATIRALLACAFSCAQAASLANVFAGEAAAPKPAAAKAPKTSDQPATSAFVMALCQDLQGHV